MAGIRALLLAVIGILTGARLALEGVRTRRRPVLQPAPGPVPVVAPPPPPAKSSAPGPPTNKPASAPGGAAAHTDVRKIQGGFLGYVFELFKRFGADHCPAWAAALSFFSILSFAPILLCALAVLGFVINDPDQAQAQVEKALASVLPGGGKTAAAQAHKIAEDFNIREAADNLRKTSGAAFLLGIGSLVWAAIQIFINAATPMNAAFRTEENRGWLKLRGTALLLLISTGFLFLLALLSSSGAQILTEIRVPGLNRLANPLLAILLTLVGVATNAVMFTIIYRFLPAPSARIDWKEARFAGIIIAILWEIAKQGFAWYLSEFGQKGYNKMYGSLGGLIGLVFWIYYTSMILLLGAEIAKLYSDKQDAKQQAA